MALAAALGPGGHAVEPEVTVALEWSAPDGCPDVEHVRADIERLVGHRIGLDRAAADRVRGRITADAAGHHLRLELRVGGQVVRRRIDAPRCETLSHAVGLIAAVAVAPLSSSAAVSSIERGQVPGPPDLAEPIAVAPPNRTVAPRAGSGPPRGSNAAGPSASRSSTTRPRQGVELAALAGGGLGLVPRLGGGLEGAVAWRVGPARVELSGGRWFRRSATVPEDGGVQVVGSGGSLRLCAALGAGRLEMPLCVAGRAVVLSAVGIAPAASSGPTRALWMGVGPAVGLSWSLSPRVGLRAQLDAWVAARRPGFHLTRGSDRVGVFQSPPVAVTVMAGPFLRLP